MSIQESLAKIFFYLLWLYNQTGQNHIALSFLMIYFPLSLLIDLSVTLLDCVPSLLYVWNCYFNMLINIAVLFQVSAHIFQALPANVLWCQQVIIKKDQFCSNFWYIFASRNHNGTEAGVTQFSALLHTVWSENFLQGNSLRTVSTFTTSSSRSCELFFAQQGAQWRPLDHHGRISTALPCSDVYSNTAQLESCPFIASTVNPRWSTACSSVLKGEIVWNQVVWHTCGKNTKITKIILHNNTIKYNK